MEIDELLKMGNKNTEKKNFEEALKSFNLVLEKDSENLRAWLEKGNALTELKRFEEAFECYNIVLEQFPNSSMATQAYYGLACLKALQKDKLEALKFLKVTIDLDPSWRNWAMDDKDLEFIRGDKQYKDIIGDFIEAKSALPEKKYKKVVKLYERSLKKYPKDIRTLLDIGWFQFAQGDKLLFIPSSAGAKTKALKYYKDAIPHFQKVIDVDPSSAKGYLGLADSFGRMGKYEEAIANYNEALKREPDDKTVYYRMGSYYMMTVDPRFPLYIKSGLSSGLDRSEKAVELFKKAIDIDPEYTEAWARLGDIYSIQENYQEAIINYSRALEIDPNIENTWFSLAEAFMKVQKFEEVLDCYKKVLEINPDMEGVMMRLGLAYIGMKKFDEAIELFEKLLESHPNLSSAWMGIAEVHSGKENFEKAIECYRKVASLEPSSGEVWLKLGVLYTQTNDYMKAADSFERSIELDRKNDPNKNVGLAVEYLFKISAEIFMEKFERDKNNPSAMAKYMPKIRAMKELQEVFKSKDGLIEEDQFTAKFLKNSLEKLRILRY